MYLVVRSGGPAPESLAAAVRAAVWSVGRDIPISEVRPMTELFARSVSAPRFRSAVLGAFAALALLLAGLGLYGTLAYSVARRTHDIGVRMAIGASGDSVVRDVLSHGVGLTAVGVGIGLAAALAATRLLSALLFGIEPTDPPTFAAAAAALIVVGACAAYVPARRAARVDPIVALRTE
jgi:ABC-type antimicrobial peptide transport system permease subunit